MVSWDHTCSSSSLVETFRTVRVGAGKRGESRPPPKGKTQQLAVPEGQSQPHVPVLGPPSEEQSFSSWVPSVGGQLGVCLGGGLAAGESKAEMEERNGFVQTAPEAADISVP